MTQWKTSLTYHLGLGFRITLPLNPTAPAPMTQWKASLTLKHKTGTVLPLGALNPSHVSIGSANIQA